MTMSDDVERNGNDQSRQADLDRKIVLGSVNGVFGVKGWVKVFSETDPRENIVSYRRWWIRRDRLSKRQAGRSPSDTQAWRQIKVLDGRRQGKTVIALIDGVETPEQAALLIGHEIAVDRSQMPSLAKDEFYWTDLIGHTVQTLEGIKLGTVERLFATGANDVVVVRKDPALYPGDDGQRTTKAVDNELLIPWVMGSVVTEVDAESRCITVDWDPDY